MKIFLLFILVVIIGLTIFFGKVGFKSGNVRIGEQLELDIMQNSNITKSEFYNKFYNSDKLLCINTWATWCQPCLEEIPILNNIKNNFSQTQIEFLSISIDNDSSSLSNFLISKKFNFLDITFQNLEYRESILSILEGRKSDDFILVKSIPKFYIVKNKKLLYKFDGIVDSATLVSIIVKNS